MKTKWRSLGRAGSSINLSLSFTLGPVIIKDLQENKLNVRLYGKKSSLFARQQCYGEFYVTLSDILQKNQVVEYIKYILPRATESLEPGVINLISDSEQEY